MHFTELALELLSYVEDSQCFTFCLFLIFSLFLFLCMLICKHGWGRLIIHLNKENVQENLLKVKWYNAIIIWSNLLACPLAAFQEDIDSLKNTSGKITRLCSRQFRAIQCLAPKKNFRIQRDDMGKESVLLQKHEPFCMDGNRFAQKNRHWLYKDAMLSFWVL